MINKLKLRVLESSRRKKMKRLNTIETHDRTGYLSSAGNGLERMFPNRYIVRDEYPERSVGKSGVLQMTKQLLNM